MVVAQAMTAMPAAVIRRNHCCPHTPPSFSVIIIAILSLGCNAKMRSLAGMKVAS